MGRRALLVGVDHYEHMKNLTWCVDDVLAIRQVLAFHENHDSNFDCHLLLSSEPASDPTRQEQVTFNRLRKELQELLTFDDLVLFYFSGHGYATEQGMYLVTQDGTATLPGMLLNDILKMANDSPAREVLLIIDSCYSGALGEPDQQNDAAQLYLRPGITLLAATRANQLAIERNGRGQFTSLVIGALKGGAAMFVDGYQLLQSMRMSNRHLAPGISVQSTNQMPLNSHLFVTAYPRSLMRNCAVSRSFFPNRTTSIV